MKNLLTVITFAVVMTFSTQNISAQSLTQDQDRPEVVAKAQVAELTNQLNLTGDQGRTLYRAYVAKEVNYRKLVTGKDINDTKVAADKKKTDDVFYEAVKKTLTNEQYSKWLKSLEQ